MKIEPVPVFRRFVGPFDFWESVRNYVFGQTSHGKDLWVFMSVRALRAGLCMNRKASAHADVKTGRMGSPLRLQSPRRKSHQSILTGVWPTSTVTLKTWELSKRQGR